MTTCTFQKFTNVTALELAELMSVIGSGHNTGTVFMHRCKEKLDGSVGIEAPFECTYRHISLMKLELSTVDGRFNIHVRVNAQIEPTKEMAPPDGHVWTHWSDKRDHEPTLVPRSLILAMHEALGIFTEE